MQYSVRVLRSVYQIAVASRKTLAKSNYFRRDIRQTWKEVVKRSLKYCRVIPLPPLVKQMGIKGKDLKDEKFLNAQADKNGQFDQFNKDIKSLDKESIMSKIIDLQFNIAEDTFTECEQELEAMRAPIP